MNNTLYFIVGIKGAAMSNMAILLTQLGYRVMGCDLNEEYITDAALQQYAIECRTGFDIDVLPEGVSHVVYSGAHGGSSSKIVKYAKEHGISVISQIELLEKIWNRYKYRIAVAGCHGKTTTSSILAHALQELKASPGYLIGAPYFSSKNGVEKGMGEYFVVEADEYGIDPPRKKTPKLLYLQPTHILCTNIDFDHPDVYDSIEDTKKTFLKFFDSKKIYACADDNNIASVITQLPRQSVETYGFSTNADLVITQYKEDEVFARFHLTYKNKPVGSFSTKLMGKKNVLNVTGVFLLLMNLGFKPTDIQSAISSFTGVKRRLELVYRKKDILVFDDYGHHPEELKASISALKSRFLSSRIIVLFQPHTYSRTAVLKNDFINSLATADLCFIAPIFPSARERASDFSITSHTLSHEAVSKGIQNIFSGDSKEQILARLMSVLGRNDIILTLGAGDIYKWKDDIVAVINNKHFHNI